MQPPAVWLLFVVAFVFVFVLSFSYDYPPGVVVVEAVGHLDRLPLVLYVAHTTV